MRNNYIIQGKYKGKSINKTFGRAIIHSPDGRMALDERSIATYEIMQVGDTRTTTWAMAREMLFGTAAALSSDRIYVKLVWRDGKKSLAVVTQKVFNVIMKRCVLDDDYLPDGQSTTLTTKISDYFKKSRVDEDGNKIPFYKLWYFWAAIVIIVIGVGNTSQRQESSVDTTQNTSSSSTVTASETKNETPETEPLDDETDGDRGVEPILTEESASSPESTTSAAETITQEAPATREVTTPSATMDNTTQSATTSATTSATGEESSTSESNHESIDEMTSGYCVDGTYVTGIPSAKGKANVCYGHGGWVINQD